MKGWVGVNEDSAIEGVSTRMVFWFFSGVCYVLSILYVVRSFTYCNCSRVRRPLFASFSSVIR